MEIVNRRSSLASAATLAPIIPVLWIGAVAWALFRIDLASKLWLRRQDRIYTLLHTIWVVRLFCVRVCACKKHSVVHS